MLVYPQGRGMDDTEKSWTIDGVTFKHVSQEELKFVYNNIESDLVRVTQKASADWIPADIYAAVRSGSTQLYLAFKDNYYAGFFVLTPLNSVIGEKTLYIWVAYSKPEYNIREAGIQFLDNLIQDTSITGMEFHSDRSGWIRAAKKYGFKAITTVFKKEV